MRPRSLLVALVLCLSSTALADGMPPPDFAGVDSSAALEHAAAQPSLPSDLGENPVGVVQFLVYAAQHRMWRFLVGGLLLVVVFALRKVAPVFSFVNTDRGGALLVLGLALGTAAGLGLLVPGPFSLAIFADGLGAAVSAAGGYVLLKKLFKPSDLVAIARRFGIGATLFLAGVALSGCGPEYSKNRAAYATDAAACAGKVTTANLISAGSLVVDLVQQKNADAGEVGEQLGLSYGLPTALCLIERLFTDFGGGAMADSNPRRSGREGGYSSGALQERHDLEILVAYDGQSGAVLAPHRDPRVLAVLRELRAHPEHLHGHHKHKHRRR